MTFKSNSHFTQPLWTKLWAVCCCAALATTTACAPVDPEPEPEPSPVVEPDAGPAGEPDAGPAGEPDAGPAGEPDAEPAAAPLPAAFDGTLDAESLCQVLMYGTASLINSIASGTGDEAQRCVGTSPSQMRPPAEMVEGVEESCKPGVPGFDVYERAITEPTISFDTQGIMDCQAAGRALLEAAANGDVIEGDPLGDNCEDLVTGSATANTECFVDWMCADGLTCSYIADDDLFRCVAPSAAGGVCSTSGGHPRPCDSGLECVDGSCVAQGQLNDACGMADTAGCADGLECDYAINQCVDDPDECPTACEAGEICIDNVCQTMANVGEACERDVGCLGTCVVCRPDAQGALTCQDRGDAGDACDVLDDCRFGTFCDTAAGSCVDAGNAGATCSADAECASGFVCRESTCTLESSLPCTDRNDCGLGDTCEFSSDCGGDTGLVCTNAVCAAAPTDGQACTDGGECADDTYCDTDGVCRAEKAAGDVCAEDFECSTALCNDGTCAIEGQSCLNSKALFPQLVFFSLFFLPSLRRWRRRRQS